MGSRVAIVTGASSGIGRATSIALVKAGWTVVAAARRASELAKLKQQVPERLHTRVIDLSVPQTHAELVDFCRKELGGIDALINNAGYGVKASFLKGNFDDWVGMFQINVLAHLHLSQLVARLMTLVGRGDIVFVSSIAQLRGLANEAVYCATKSAVGAITESLRVELSQSGIRVTSVLPGTTRTEFELKSMSRVQAKELYAKTVPLDASDVARVIVFMLEQPPNVCLNTVQVRPLRQLV